MLVVVDAASLKLTVPGTPGAWDWSTLEYYHKSRGNHKHGIQGYYKFHAQPECPLWKHGEVEELYGDSGQTQANYVYQLVEKPDLFFGGAG